MLLNLKRIVAIATAALAALALLVGPALAMRVSPMVVEMESRGSNATARIEVQNINQGKLAFQTRVYRMEIDPDGQVKETPADDRFLIFPPQGALPPGGRQVIRIQWLGEPELAASEAYYVSIEQLPVPFEPGSEDAADAQVQVLYHMRALVVVAPPGAKPDVTAESVKAVTFQPPAPKGTTELPPREEAVEIILKNDGRRHAMMSNFRWVLTGTDKDGKYLRVDVSPDELTTAVGTGYVPALGVRGFRLPIAGFGPSPIDLKFAN